MFWAALAATLVISRLCHAGLLWEGDAYPLAAAGQWLRGKPLYTGIWFDKPPLLPLFYLLWGALPGWPLRLAGALYALAACTFAAAFAGSLWGRREALFAAGLLAFFLTFGIPSAVIPVASDLLLVAPHLAAVWLAFKRRPFWSGVVVGAACFISPKGVFVLLACLLWNPGGAVALAGGFAVSAGAGVAALAMAGALDAYLQEVWVWGRLYAARTFVAAPLAEGALRTANWLGFHAALALGAGAFLVRRMRAGERTEALRWAVWVLLALAGVAAGLRFFPRYYFLFLPPMVLMAARGLAVSGRLRYIAALLLLVPLVRFAPAYWAAATDPAWRDTAMDRDSRAAAAQVSAAASPGDSLLVWGYRPEIFVYTGLPAASRYLDSQPLSGVPADRHLSDSTPVETAAPARRRAELMRCHPSWIIDGIGPYNPRLAITQYADLTPWLAGYREFGRTGGTVLYHREPAGR